MVSGFKFKMKLCISMSTALTHKILWLLFIYLCIVFTQNYPQLPTFITQRIKALVLIPFFSTWLCLHNTTVILSEICLTMASRKSSRNTYIFRYLRLFNQLFCSHIQVGVNTEILFCDPWHFLTGFEHKIIDPCMLLLFQTEY